MPKPSPEHAPIMRDLAHDMLEAFPGASAFIWLIDESDPEPFVSSVYDKDGEWLNGDEGAFDTRQTQILRKYSKDLGWNGREVGIGWAFSVADACDTSDPVTGGLEPKYRTHPGLDIL